MEHLRCKVAAEKAPSGAVRSRGDIVEVGRSRDPIDGESLRAVGENGAVLDEGLMGDGAVSDDDGRGRADVDSEDWPVFGNETTQQRFKLKRGLAEP